MKFRIDEVRELIDVLSESSFESITVDEGDFVVEVRRSSPSVTPEAVLQVMPDSADPVTVEGSTTGGSQAALDGETVATSAGPCEMICSQLVGRVSLCDESGAPYASEGQEVVAGHTICMVESLKQFHSVTADRPGVIVDMHIAHGDIVEYGQPLITLGGGR